jgi:hypothetical protein
MPDIDPSIALSAKAPDPMKSLSGLLDVAKGVQGMQAQRLTMTGQDQQNQSNAISLGEKKAMQQALSDPTQYTGADGSIDWGKTLPLVMKAAPTTGMDVIGKMMNTQQAATTSKQLITNLDSSKRQMLGQVAQSLQGKDPSTINDTFDAIAKQSPELATAIPMIKQVLTHAGDNGGQQGVNTALGHLAQMTMTPSDQQSYNTPTALSISNGIQNSVINTKPGVNGLPIGASIPNSTQTQLVPLSQQQEIGTDLQGNAVVNRKDAMGNVQAPTAMPGSNATPMTAYPAGESADSKKALEDESMVAKNAASQGPQIHDINKTIISEASKGFATGKLGALTQDLASRTGYKFAVGEDATSYNMLGKMLARSAAQAAQSMGPHTNAGLQSATEQNGSMEYTPAAITKIAHLNDALQTGADNYNLGKDAAIKAGGSVFAKRQFDTQWAQNANVDALKLTNALKLGDTAQKDEVIQSLGGRNSDKFNSVVKNVQNLHALTQKGSL